MTANRLHCYLLSERAAVIQSHSSSISLDLQKQIWAIAHALQALKICIDIVPGMNNLTAIFNPLEHSGATMLAHLNKLANQISALDFPGRDVEIPVHYGGEYGPDIASVAAHTGLSIRELVQQHSAAHYLVYFLGFQPGFAYLGGLPPALATPRLAEPRLKVPAGSVGIGGSQTGIYPAASPGGWQLIGRTDLRLFDVHQSPPSTLLPGDCVRFVIASLNEKPMQMKALQ